MMVHDVSDLLSRVFFIHWDTILWIRVGWRILRGRLPDNARPT